MCGIIYKSSKENQPVNKSVLQLYKHQKERGSEGFGILYIDKNKTYYNTDESQTIKQLKKYKSTNILFHHRLPTSTKNVLNACHPFAIKIGKVTYYTIHNGYLQNEYDLKQKHNKLGIEYKRIQPDGTFNDSESLAVDIALYLSGKQKKLYSQGAIAFITYTSTGELYFGRNEQNPLYLHNTEKQITIRSKGKGILINSNILYKFKNDKITQKKLTIPEYKYSSNNYNFLNYNYDIDQEIAKAQNKITQLEFYIEELEMEKHNMTLFEY